MKLHIINVGKPRLLYAQDGWHEYWPRLGHFHELTVTHLNDRYASDSKRILKAADHIYKVVLDGGGQQMTSEKLADFLSERAQIDSRISFIIGGPDGLPAEVIKQADYRWSLGQLTFPHDLAMVMLLEALYRASSINAGHPYHRA